MGRELVLKRGTVADGSGRPSFQADVMAALLEKIEQARTGIEHLFIRGVQVIADGKLSGKHAGSVHYKPM